MYRVQSTGLYYQKANTYFENHNIYQTIAYICYGQIFHVISKNLRLKLGLKVRISVGIEGRVWSKSLKKARLIYYHRTYNDWVMLPVILTCEYLGSCNDLLCCSVNLMSIEVRFMFGIAIIECLRFPCYRDHSIVIPMNIFIFTVGPNDFFPVNEVLVK